jgi:sigma-E factor negative regulatory protein RseB
MSHLHHKISALVDGELHGSERQRALSHIGRCADCRHELEATMALKRRMAGLSYVEPSPDLFASLDEATVGGRRRVCGTLPQRGAVRARLAPVLRRIVVGAGSVSVAVLSLAYVVGAPPDLSAEQVTPPVDEYTADFASDTGLSPLSDPAAAVLSADPQPIASVVPGATPARSTLTGHAHSAATATDAVADLKRAMSAPNRYAYAGVREIDSFDSGSATTLRLDVEHYPGQGTSFEVDNASADTTPTFITQREAGASGGLSNEPLRLLINAYDLSVVSAGSVLDRPATVIEARRGGVLEARFWVDDATGLLLRREMYDGGRLVRATGFTTLQVSRRGFLPHLPPELEAPSTIQLAMTSAPLLSDDGWTCPPRLPDGFTLTRLDRLETNADVMGASYTDGLSTISLFEQRGTLNPGGFPGFTRRTVDGSEVFTSFGLPSVAVWESGGTVYTMVTDAPRDTASDVIGSLPHAQQPSPGPGERLETGLQRLTSALRPAS